MRHFLLAIIGLLVATGITLAAEVTLLKYDAEKKELTVKVGEAEKSYKLTDKTKVTFEDKDGNKKDGTVEAAAKALGSPGAKGKLKFDLTADNDKDTVSSLTLKMTKKKN
jgi:hypothetical protein